MKKEINKILLKYGKNNISKGIETLINKLSSEIIFDIKVLKSSIHFTKDKITFLVCGFRRNKDYYFIEFYSDKSINDKLIIKELKKDIIVQNVNKVYIICRIEIINEISLNEKLIKWIIKSYNLV